MSTLGDGVDRACLPDRVIRPACKRGGQGYVRKAPAGQPEAIAPKEGFRFAFENGADFVCAGMLDFQVKENVRTAIETLSKQVVKNRARPWAG